jgi:acetyl esterase/lipase/lysophospholipase L1-like esterase
MRLIDIIKTCSWVIIMISLRLSVSGQEVISLYKSRSPDGYEMFPLKEKQTLNDTGEITRIENISQPTLTVFRPEKGHENGSAVIVCPGGAFLFLDYIKEGVEVARWFNERGITAFILKYRLVPVDDELNNLLIQDLRKGYFSRVDSINARYVPYAVEDGKEAVRYVRRNAGDFGVDPDRIGMIGFSAGGALVASVAQNYDKESRPDFVIPIYAYCDAMLNNVVMPDAPPMFMAMTADDRISNCNTALYEKWRDAKIPVEIHIFAGAGHGYGMRPQNKDSDQWPYLLDDWLTLNGYTMTKEVAGSLPPLFMVMLKRSLSEKAISDWAAIRRYESKNRITAETNKEEDRVIFMGNSITDFWIALDSSFFLANNFIDRGISGQQTDQMLARFRSDVINLHPSVVVILAGTNDIHAEKPLDWIMDNIESMVELARANNITPVLCSVTPVSGYPLKPYIDAAGTVKELNRMIKDYADRNMIIFTDYYSAMVDGRGGMRGDLTEDGIHPNHNGYKIMEPLVSEAVRRALKKHKTRK